MDRVILTHESIPDMGKVAIHIATHASIYLSATRSEDSPAESSGGLVSGDTHGSTRYLLEPGAGG